jgi:hypothetical protein
VLLVIVSTVIRQVWERVAYMVNYDALKKRYLSRVQLTGQIASARC